MRTAIRRTAPALRLSLSLRTVARLLALRQSRARLATLDDHLLRDIGLSREQAQHESERPLWDAPPHWHR